MNEHEIAQSLSLPVQFLAHLRSGLIEGRHFTRQPAIVYTDAGIDALLATLGADAGDMTTPTVAILRVVQLVTNASIVLAENPEKKDAPGLLTLRVPYDTAHGQPVSHFRPGQHCLARHIDGATWAFVGPRPKHPRDKAAFLQF
jgi:hypothetical protein